MQPNRSAAMTGRRYAMIALFALALGCAKSTSSIANDAGAGGRRNSSTTGSGGRMSAGGSAGHGGNLTGGNNATGAGGASAGAAGAGAAAGNIADGGIAVANPPPPPSMGLQFTDDALIEQATVALLSCTSNDGFYQTLAILRGGQDTYAYQGGLKFMSCEAMVNSGCAGVLSCFGFAARQPQDVCGTCQGNTAIFCGVDLNARWDCDAINATCQAGKCSSPDQQPCDRNTFVNSCDAQGRPAICDNLVQHGAVCSDLGLNCVDGPSIYEPYCQGEGPRCVGPIETEVNLDPLGTGCDGNVLQACVAGREDSIDCRNWGSNFSCQQVGSAYFCGEASECDPATYQYTCEGTEIVFCDAGRLVRVDCTSFGFTSCQEGLSSGVCQ